MLTASELNDLMDEFLYRNKRKAEAVEDPKIAEILRKVAAAPRKPLSELKRRPGMVVVGPSMKTTWTDTEPGSRKAYVLEKHMDEDGEVDLLTLARQVFQSFTTDVSARNVCYLLYLTYQLKDPAGEPLFGDVDRRLLSLDSIPFREIGKTHLKRVVNYGVMTETVDDNDEDGYTKLLNAYCFLAGSYLMLFSKSEESYDKAEVKFKNSFAGFYGYDFPLQQYHPPLDVIRSIKFYFNSNILLRNTLYNLLYAGRVTNVGKKIKDCLYGIHLEMTGLHSLSLFMKCMDAYNVDSITLRKTFDTAIFKGQLDALTEFFKNHFDTGNDREVGLEMWRYARLFDGTFMSRLQTRNCLTFVSTLAFLYHFRCPVGNKYGNAHQITRLDEMTPYQKRIAQSMAITAAGYLNSEKMTGTMAIIPEILQ